MRKSFLLVLVLFFGLMGNAFAEPCAFVTDPADIRFVELKDIAKFLEKDLDMGKGITKLIGNKVIDHKFRKAGIPDPAKEGLAYSIVGREMPVDQLNVAFILKGNLDSKKFVEFADKRYKKYFKSLKKQEIEYTHKAVYNTRINGKTSRVYPFAFRASEAVVTYFNDYIIISTVPQKNYSLIAEIIRFLSNKKEFSRNQAEVISYTAAFVPLKQERKEIENFESRFQGFAANIRKGFKKLTNKKVYNDEKAMAKVESDLKGALSRIEKFSYQIDAGKEKNGYKYDINLMFKCNSEKEASKLKELMLSWLAYTSSKALSEQDMVSFKANKVLSSRDTCVFSVKLGASQEEQYQFSSLMMTLMMQDRRFNAIFKR